MVLPPVHYGTRLTHTWGSTRQKACGNALMGQGVLKCLIVAAPQDGRTCLPAPHVSLGVTAERKS